MIYSPEFYTTVVHSVTTHLQFCCDNDEC